MARVESTPGYEKGMEVIIIGGFPRSVYYSQIQAFEPVTDYSNLSSSVIPLNKHIYYYLNDWLNVPWKEPEEGTMVMVARSDEFKNMPIYPSDGSILISGGVTGVCTPSSGMEGPIDFNGTGTQTGGTLIIASGSGMTGGMGRMGGMGGMGASLSGQASMTLSCSGSAGETIVLQNESGETLGEFTPKSAYGSVTISSSSLQEGSGCTVLVSGKTLYSGVLQSTTAGTQNNGYGNWNNGGGRGGQHGRRGW
ncbi:MAG: hypothetical protein II173_08420 [Firmicutes bacterium]|nr:hypothetical protein [Bacillota bacterium]